MDKLIFGSTAARFWFPEWREPKDIDYISREGKIEKREQHYWVPSFQKILDQNKHDTYVDPNFLLTIKLSHAGWDIHWQKTMSDILQLKRAGCVGDPALYRSLVKDWISVHGKKWVAVKNKKSQDFFNDAVTRRYDHDWLHQVVAYGDEPLYFRILVHPELNGKDVTCSKEKFNSLTEDEKELLVREEIWVAAIERFIAERPEFSPRRAYGESLKKLCTSMSSGWFKEWILFNFDRLYPLKDLTCLEKFNKEISE